MDNFLRSFAIGFIGAANERFREDRALQITNDAAKAKLLVEKVFAYTTIRAKTAAENKKEKDAAALRKQYGISGAGEARIQSGLGTAADALEFRQNLTPEARAAFDKTTFVPGQPAQQSLEQFLASSGIGPETIKKAGIDLTDPRFQGQAARTPQLTGAQGFNLSQLAAPKDVKDVTTKVVTKQNIHIRNAVQSWYANTELFQLISTPEGDSFRLVLPGGKKGNKIALNQLAEVKKVERIAEQQVNAVIQAAEKAGQEIATIDFNQIISNVVKEVNPQRWQTLQYTPPVTPLKEPPTIEETATGAFKIPLGIGRQFAIPPRKQSPVTKPKEEIDAVLKTLEGAATTEDVANILGKLKQSNPALYKQVRDKLMDK